MPKEYSRRYDFTEALDDCWEAIPEKGWTWEVSPQRARMANEAQRRADVYLRPCLLNGDTVEMQFAPGAPRKGIFVFAFSSGFEHITFELSFDKATLKVETQEAHKAQPRYLGKAPADFVSLKVVRERDDLPGLPYEGSKVTVVCDDKPVVTVGEIDFLPECLFSFGLQGPGEFTLSSLSIHGGPRPRPEYVNVGVWKQDAKPTTAQNVEGLLEGVRQAAAAGVEILVTPETSLTGLRMEDPEFTDKASIQAELRRFQEGVAAIPGAPYTLIGYPDWMSGSEVEAATIDQVMVNRHRFVRPDGTLGPSMAKVHTCEAGMWHGREYNLQRVAGVEVAMGVCHDGKYADVWATGVMGGARLCLHPAAGGTLRGHIPTIIKGYGDRGQQFDAFYASVNAGGGAAIEYPTSNRKVPQTVLAVTPDLTEANPTYPEYSDMGDLLAHARIRLWDATGCYPMRTLRSGARRYHLWAELMPTLVDV